MKILFHVGKKRQLNKGNVGHDMLLVYSHLVSHKLSRDLTAIASAWNTEPCPKWAMTIMQ
ncbi:hypothetical protein BLOT_015586 [Blomia tropicalis]|nr:hypothetical protein BLOT_015586 [Blomia tropicalis]